MLMQVSNDFGQHVQDNVNDIQRVESGITALIARTSSNESALALAQQTIVDMSARIEKMSTGIQRSDAIDNAPTIISIKQDITDMKAAIDREYKDLRQNKIPALEQKVEEKMYGFGNAMMAHGDTKFVPMTKAFHDMKSTVDHLEVMMGSMPAGTQTTADMGMVNLATAVGEAVAKALQHKEPSGENWQGVAGSRVFTTRVKEYAGPTNTFSNWSATFKSNIPKDMRMAIERAEKELKPISDDDIAGTSFQKWDEDVWRCLSGVLKGNWETLVNTLKYGQGLELWRQLVAGHVVRSPDHADSIHRALYNIPPAKNLGEVRHKINQVKAVIVRHDELADAKKKMQDGSKRTLINKVLPPEVARHLAMQPRSANVEDLIDKILKYITDMGGFEIAQGHGPTGMDIGNVGAHHNAPTMPQEITVNDLMATVNGMKDTLATLVTGKAGPPGFARSPDGRKGKGKDGKGKGKGKG